MLEPLGTLEFGLESLPGNGQPTAASVASGGSRILIRTYSSVFLFERRAGEPMMAALERAPRRLHSPPLKQGEAISFAEQGNAFVTVSEGLRPGVWCVRFQ